MKNENKYPIKAVAQLTGLSAHVIRAWEKRYNAVIPFRTEKNRRLYSDNDIEKLKLLFTLTSRGHNIGGIAGQSLEELKNLISNKLHDDQSALNFVEIPVNDTGSEDHLIACLKSVYALNTKELENNLYKASVKLSRPLLLDKVIGPLITEIGKMWKDGEIRVYHEHLLTASIRNFLANLIDSAKNPETAPKILITTPIGQLHELGALIAAVIASSEGWNVTYLGPDLPVEEIVGAAEQLKCNTIALSIVYPSDDFALRNELLKLKKILPHDSSLIVGGKGAQGYLDILNQIEAFVVEDVISLKNCLSTIRENRYN